MYVIVVYKSLKEIKQNKFTDLLFRVVYPRLNQIPPMLTKKNNCQHIGHCVWLSQSYRSFTEYFIQSQIQQHGVSACKRFILSR